MKKGNFTGWRDVYSFELKQTLKSKSFLFVLVLMCVVALASSPIISLIKGNGGEKKLDSIETVYVIDESLPPIEDLVPSAEYTAEFAEAWEANWKIDLSGMRDKDAIYEGITFQREERSLEAVTEELEGATSEDKALLLTIDWEASEGFILRFIKGTRSGVKSGQVETLSEGVMEYFEEARLEALNVSGEEMAYIEAPIETEVITLGEAGQEEGDEEGDAHRAISMSQYNIFLVGITLLIFIISLAGGMVSSSIVVEKSSRVIEYLIISVRPLAVIVGKVLAVLTIVALQVACIGVCAGVSSQASAAILGTGSQTSWDAERLLVELSEAGTVSIRPLDLLCALLFVVCGILFFCILAGLLGSTVSRTEELAEGLKAYTFALMIGAYMGIALGVFQLAGSGGSGVDVLEAVCYLCPIASVFVVPANLFIGQASMGWALSGLAILLVCLAVLCWFTSRVYEGVILYNGNRLKWKEMLSISRGERGERG